MGDERPRPEGGEIDDPKAAEGEGIAFRSPRTLAGVRARTSRRILVRAVTPREGCTPAAHLFNDLVRVLAPPRRGGRLTQRRRRQSIRRAGHEKARARVGSMR